MGNSESRLWIMHLPHVGLSFARRLLPQGSADYALSATHTGTCFRTNTDRLFPDLPPGTA